jgi:LytS/YehU family sensor histidine kinase
MLLQAATEYVAGRESARIVARLAFMAFELPLLMLSLSAGFAWSLRRRTGAGLGIATGAAIATVFGCTFGVLYGWVSAHVPELRLHFPNGVSMVRTGLFGVLNGQLYFGLWALAFAFPEAVESARVRTLEAQRLRSEAELSRLRAHLEPHFLLNTLNAIAGLVTEDPREARRLLSCLGDLLREAMQGRSEVQRLDEQVEWLRRYAQILEARHRGMLRFTWQVDPATEGVLLPRLLLQPLVENAVKHGALLRDDGAGEVSLRTSLRDGGTLVCVIEDNGPGLAGVDVREGAFGLEAVRRRLELEVVGGSLVLESTGHLTRSIVELAPSSSSATPARD